MRHDRSHPPPALEKASRVTDTTADFHPLSTAAQPVFDTVRELNPNEPEFHQAVHEVLHSIGPVLERHPEYIENGVLDRLIEPERQVIFRVPWIDDAGRQPVNRGYRVQYNS